LKLRWLPIKSLFHESKKLGGYLLKPLRIFKN